MEISNVSGGLAIDPSFAKLKHYTENSDSQIKAASEQFEAIFLQMVLQQMHAGTEALSSENSLFSSSSMKTFRDMYDSQLAHHLAGRQQLGFAEAITEQVGKQLDNFEKKFNISGEGDALDNKERENVQMQQEPLAFQQPLWVL